MAKLGWGTPSIITVELGLLLDLPKPMFAIVGVLRAVLPTEDAPHPAPAGQLHRRARFRSRLLVLPSRPVTTRGCWSSRSPAAWRSWSRGASRQTFALSVGGFHPDFRDIPTIPALPDGFRNMARIGISLLSDDNPRLKVESYFAVTSNTVQFGARVELYAAAAGFNVYGFLGYDVLFQFDPFRFIAEALRRHRAARGRRRHRRDQHHRAARRAHPWDARGTATLTILFFDIDVGFHVTWGDPPPAIAATPKTCWRC